MKSAKDRLLQCFDTVICREPGPDAMTLYVSGLANDVSESSLKALFCEFGLVSGVDIPRDHETKDVRGWGFVTMEEPYQAKQAIAGLSGRYFHGRRLKVSYAHRQPE